MPRRMRNEPRLIGALFVKQQDESRLDAARAANDSAGLIKQFIAIGQARDRLIGLAAHCIEAVKSCQFLCRMLALGDISGNAGGADDFAARIPKRRFYGIEPAPRAIVVVALFLVALALAGANDFAIRL